MGGGVGPPEEHFVKLVQDPTTGPFDANGTGTLNNRNLCGALNLWVFGGADNDFNGWTSLTLYAQVP